MFLKSISFGDDITIQYLNRNGKKNKDFVCGMETQLSERKIEFEALYSEYLNESTSIVSMSLDSKCEVMTVGCSTSVGGIKGGFTFSYPFMRYSSDDIEQLEKQELYESAGKAVLLNKLYDLTLSLSEFVDENLLNILSVTSDQLALFDSGGAVLA